MRKPERQKNPKTAVWVKNHLKRAKKLFCYDVFYVMPFPSPFSAVTRSASQDVRDNHWQEIKLTQQQLQAFTNFFFLHKVSINSSRSNVSKWYLPRYFPKCAMHLSLHGDAMHPVIGVVTFPTISANILHFHSKEKSINIQQCLRKPSLQNQECLCVYVNKIRDQIRSDSGGKPAAMWPSVDVLWPINSVTPSQRLQP